MSVIFLSHVNLSSHVTCHMSILRNGRVDLSNLRVYGPQSMWDINYCSWVIVDQPNIKKGSRKLVEGILC